MEEEGSSEQDFYQKLKGRKYKINNKNTILIFTNCHGGYGEEGHDLGSLISQLLKVGSLYLNIDSSPFNNLSNLGFPLTTKSDDGEVNEGWVVFRWTVYPNGGIVDFVGEDTGNPCN